MPTFGKFGALDAFARVIARATPALGFHYDLSERVYPTLIVPESLPFVDIAGEQWAYVCVPLIEDGVSYERIAQQQMFQRTFMLRAFGFVGEGSTDRLVTTETAALARLEDDVVRAVLMNPRLDGTVQSCEPVSASSVAGWPVKSKRYGEVEMAFRVMQKVTVETLQAVA